MKLPRDLHDMMIMRMTAYGMGLGAIAALLISLVVQSQHPIDYFSYSALCSTSFGMGFGLLCGLSSGIGMAWITHLLFPEVKNATVYKLTMMLITACVSCIGLAIPIWTLGSTRLPYSDIRVENDWMAGLSMSLVIAVYISQRVAGKYLRESDPRKLKETIA